jgi:ribonuclease-3
MAVADGRSRAAALDTLQERLGYRWQDPAWLDTALTHPSWRNEHPGCQIDNQRLEFLGDAVLGLVASQTLIERLPQHREGQLTMLKSQLVRESSLAAIATALGLGEVLRLGRGEARTGGRQRDSVLADAVEAVIGAVFSEAGFAAADAVVRRLVEPHVVQLAAVQLTSAEAGPHLAAGLSNWKTAVQELLQAMGAQPPTYTVTASLGPDHARHFEVEAVAELQGQSWVAHGAGKSKKAAEIAAASRLYETVSHDVPAAWGFVVPGRAP